MVIFPLFHPTEKVFLWKQIRINSHLGPTRCFENISSPEFIKLLKGEIRKTCLACLQGHVLCSRIQKSIGMQTTQKNLFVSVEISFSFFHVDFYFIFPEGRISSYFTCMCKIMAFLHCTLKQTQPVSVWKKKIKHKKKQQE